MIVKINQFILDTKELLEFIAVSIMGDFQYQVVRREVRRFSFYAMKAMRISLLLMTFPVALIGCIIVGVPIDLFRFVTGKWKPFSKGEVK